MNEIELKNVLLYGLIAVLNIALGLVAVMIADGTAYGFRPGDSLEPAGVQLAGVLTVVTAGLASWLTANRPRIGSATIAASVDKRRRAGQSRKTMVVRTAGSPPALADDTLNEEQAARVADILESRMRATPAKEN